MMLVQNWEKRLTARPVWLIVLLGLILNLSGTCLLPLIDRDEPRFAEASREMLEQHDWVVPTFNGEPRYDKPPLIYWVQMIAFQCLGETPLAARLPNALFAMGTSLLIFFWTRRMAAPRTAVIAAIIFTTCLQVLIHAHLAVADMPMIFFVCAALWSGWELTRPEAAAGWCWWWVFFVSLALGFLAKGPVAWLPIGGLLLGRRVYPRAFSIRPGRFVLGMLLTLGIVALWGIPALRQTHGEFLKVGLGYHVVHRSFEVMDGHGARTWTGWLGSAPFFPVVFFFSFFPWAFWVPKALWNWWPTRQKDVFGWYLLTQAGLVFLVFTIVRTKLPHYTLPAFPCLAIWLARTEAAGLIRHLQVARLATIMAVLVLMVTIAGGLAIRPLFIAHDFFEKMRPQLKPQMQFATIDYKEPSLVWEFRQILTNHLQMISPEAAVDFVSQKKPFILILPTSLYETNLSQWGTNLQTVQIKGINWSRSKKAALTALIHP